MANSYANAPWGFAPQVRAQNQPVLPANQARLPNPIGEDGIALLKKGGGGTNFVVTQEELLKVLCNHRHNGRFDVYQDNEYPEGVYRCGICGDLIDLRTKFDPKFIQKIIDHLWAAYNTIKVNNNGIVGQEVMKDLAYGMLMVRNIPQMLNMVNNNIQRQMAQQVWQPNGYRGVTAMNAVNMITGNPGYSYNPSYQTQDGSYWRAQDVIQAQMNQDAYLQSQGGNPFVAGGAPIMIPAQQPVQYVQAPPPPQQYVQVTLPADQYGNPIYPTQIQSAPQYAAPPAAAGSVVPEVVTPQPVQGQTQDGAKASKLFKK